MFPLLLSEYHPKDIFNADMCGLLSSLLPYKICFQRQKLLWVKRSKYRITVLMHKNRNGCEMIPLMVTGKLENRST
jgi:hypothetical protein